MRPRFRLGVRAFLFVALGGSAAVPVALLGSYQAERFAARELETTDRQALTAAWAAAEQLTSAMATQVHVANSLSAQIAVRGSFDQESLREVLHAHALTQPNLLGAYVADASGTSLLNVKQGGATFAGGMRYADRDYFKNIIATGRATISGAAVGRVTHVLTVQIAAPIFNAQGELTGITCSSLNLDTITRQAAQNVRGLVDGRLVFVDAEGRRIVDSENPRALEPDDVSRYDVFSAVKVRTGELRVGTDDHGRKVRVAAVGLDAPVAGWRVMASTPESSIAARVRRVRVEAVLVALGSLLAALGIAAWLAGWISRPLRALADAGEAISRGGNDEVPALPGSAPRELERLSSVLASMLASLRAHARGLEAKVAERTSELSRALEVIQKNEQLIRDDIENARLFQLKMLPTLPEQSAFDVAVHYAAFAQVSGDIYDIAALPGKPPGLRVFLSDATGHGVQASMRTVLLKSAYDRMKADEPEPSSLLAALNDYLVAEFPEGELHSTGACLDLIPAEDGVEVRFVNAGGPPVYVFSGNGSREIYASGPLLGAERVRFSAPECFRLRPGELLLIASDGLIEQSNGRRERFEALLTRLSLATAPSASAALARLLFEFEAFRGTLACADDLTVILIVVR